jgi:hypothetical protein
MDDESKQRWDVDALMALLAPSVGNERAKAAVQSALAALAIRKVPLDADAALRVFKYLQGTGGLTAIAARRAASAIGGDAGRATPAQPMDRPTSVSDGRSDTPPRGVAVAGSPVTRAELAALLSHAVGNAEALAAVDRAAMTTGFGPSGTVEAGLRLLDALALEPGLLGITARFAKARFALRAE